MADAGSGKRNVVRALPYYLLAVVLCIVILVLVMRLWEADPGVPFTYDKDALWVITTFKTILDNGQYLHNSYLGMPFGQDMYDFPQAHNLDMLIQAVILLLTHNAAMSVNLYFLLTFPLTVVTAMVAMRQFKVSYPSAIVGSLLFTFVPYHFLRGLPHIVLSSYFMIPLVVVVLYWVFNREISLDVKKMPPSQLIRSKLAISIAICLLVSATFIYYSYFACFFLLVIGIAAAFYHKDRAPLVVALVLFLILAAGVLANISPSIVYMAEHGRNGLVASRAPIETEQYGLKIFQMLLPVENHRIPFFAYITMLYDRNAPLVNENSMAALGVVGSLGFVALVAWMLFRGPARLYGISGGTGAWLDCLGTLNLAAVLVAAVGGFGEIIAASVMPWVRDYNRISIFIAFFSLLAVFIIVDMAYARFVRGQKKYLKALFFLGLGCLLLFGIFDQTSDGFVPKYAELKQVYTSDQRLVDRMEAALPQNAMVFQLPYKSFPESPPVNRLREYELFKGYIHSTGLRWSYGAMAGRDGDRWIKAVSGMPLDTMLETLSFAGFGGIYVDGYGYADGGKNITAQLAGALGDPIVSDDGRLYFFDMAGYNGRLRGNYTSAEWDAKKSNALNVSAI